MSIYLSKKLILFSAILILSACSQNRDSKSLNIKDYDSLIEVSALDSQISTDSNDDLFISAASLAATDNKNNIYLVDPTTWKIHSFTGDLKHRWTAGGKGNGPGLFNIISALYVDNQYLYVYEHISATMTQYSLKGNRLNEWIVGDGGHPVNSIRKIPTGTYVASGWNEESETAVNIYSEDFKAETYNLVKINEFLSTQKPEFEKQIVRNYPGSAISPKDSTIIYAPAGYTGQLPVYTLNPEGDWTNSNTLKGYKKIKNPISFRESSSGDDERSHLSGFNPDGGYFHTEFTSRSFGLYNLKNGRIAHLSTWLNEKDQWDLIIENFKSDNLELQGYTIIEDFIQSQQFSQVPLWMDEDGQIYLYENSDTPFRVLKVKKKSNE